MKTQLLVAFLLVLVAVNCAAPVPVRAPTSAPVVPTAPVAPTAVPKFITTATSVPPTATATPALPTITPTRTATATPTPLPPQPRAIKFKASDGQELNGRYYPAAVNPAPLVILMHWARGDQYDWVEIAYWFQNRGLGGKTPNPNKLTWLDSSWFPPMPPGKSFAVFTFTFRGCEGGCRQFNSAGWLLDAQAAIKTVMLSEQPGTNDDPFGGPYPLRFSPPVIIMGASIGADGIIYAGRSTSAWHWALSPAGYLGVPFADAVKATQPSANIWCFYGERDPDPAVPSACKSVSGPRYHAIAYPSNVHGMQMLDPKVQPNPLQLILDWIKSN